MDKFGNRYRIKSHRMPYWDYAGTGIYFITFVTQNRTCALGYISDQKMILSDFGKIVDEEWHKSFRIRKELFLNEYVIMPNHLHAIVVLKKMDGEIDRIVQNIAGQMPHDFCVPNDSYASYHGGILRDGEVLHVETHGRASLQSPSSLRPSNLITRNPPIRKPKSLSSFVAGFKSAVNSKIDDRIDYCNLSIPKYNKNNSFFQKNYHDHIVRNVQEYERIRNYIVNNPINWEQDTLHQILEGKKNE